VDDADSSQARIWGHGHCWAGASYLQAPMAVQSPSGRFVLFASRWNSNSGTQYPFIAEAG